MQEKRLWRYARQRCFILSQVRIILSGRCASERTKARKICGQTSVAFDCVQSHQCQQATRSVVACAKPLPPVFAHHNRNWHHCVVIANCEWRFHLYSHPTNPTSHSPISPAKLRDACHSSRNGLASKTRRRFLPVSGARRFGLRDNVSVMNYHFMFVVKVMLLLPFLFITIPLVHIL